MDLLSADRFAWKACTADRFAAIAWWWIDPESVWQGGSRARRIGAGARSRGPAPERD